MFEILHVSDLHIGLRSGTVGYLNIPTWLKARMLRQHAIGFSNGTALFGSHCPEISERLARFVSRRNARYDAVLISGDLACSGEGEDLLAAKEYVEGTPGERLPYLSALQKPTLATAKDIVLMPGNHDRYLDRAGAAGGRVFNQAFASKWPTSGFVHSRGFEDAAGKKLAIVLVDLSLLVDRHATEPTVFCRMGQGRAYREAMRELTEHTSQLRAKFEGIGVVWVSHFPPVDNNLGWLKSLQLQERRHLIDAAVAHDVPFILAGHLHTPFTETHSGIEVHCAGTATEFMCSSPNAIHELTIEVDAGVARLVRKTDILWDEDAQEFG